MNNLDGKKHIGCSTDDNYAQHCGVMLCSLFENNKQSKYVVHILMSRKTLSQDNCDKLFRLIERYGSYCIFHDVDTSKIENMPDREKRPLGPASYYRLLFASIIDLSVHHIFYLDCDIIVNGSIDEIFNLDLNDYGLAAVLDSEYYTDEHRMEIPIPYDKCMFCSGVMYVNLDYWREHNVEEKLLYYARIKRKRCLHDQDALNAVFHNKWFRLAPKWNKFNSGYLGSNSFLTESDRQEYINSPIIIHFLSNLKPWEYIPGLRYRELYYKYLDLTEWKGFVPIRREQDSYFGLRKMLFFSNMYLWLAEREMVWVYKFIVGTISIIKFIFFIPSRLLWRRAKCFI